MTDKTCMSYWFPKIKAAGLPVPRTTMLDMPEDALRAIYNVFDMLPVGDEAEPFFEKVMAVAEDMGFPVFLRTGHTSGKHDWSRTCFVEIRKQIPSHVIALVEFSGLVDFVGLPVNVWAVREFLPTKPVGRCDAYHGMPVCKEFRFFVNGGEIECFHPYWPDKALEQGRFVPKDGFELEDLYATDDEAALREIASSAGLAVGGRWSVDLLETENGWYVTDMAEAEKSFHWEGCDNA